MTQVTLQSVSVGDSCYFGDSAITCMTDQYVGAFGGEAMLGVLLGVTIFGTLYIASDGSMATPTVALILIGGGLVGMLPSNYSQIAMYVIYIGLAAALWQVLQKYVLSPATQ